MKTSPASVHLRAKAEFSLSLNSVSMLFQCSTVVKTYEAIPRVDADATLLLGSVDNLFTIKIG